MPSFAYHERLHLQKDFRLVLKKARKLYHPAILVYIYNRKDNSAVRRLGLITSRKLGTAVERNRIKRRLREIFRLNKHSLPEGIDLIFIPKKPISQLNYHAMEKIILSKLSSSL